jgi:hypothetical protein
MTPYQEVFASAPIPSRSDRFRLNISHIEVA